MMHTLRTPLAAVAALSLALPAQNFEVVPAANATTDALAYEWIAGASRLHRQQTLVGASHLTNLVGRDIVAIELRRTAMTRPFPAGAADLTVSLSTSPNLPIAIDNTFAANIGPDVLQVFSGTVSLPASPATGVAGSAVAWTAANTVRIALTTPFRYQGGSLCIDVLGTPIGGQNAWWLADAAEEVVPGTSAVHLGNGCGIYGGPAREWSEVHERSLVPGGYGVFRANGTPYGPAFAIFGTATATPFSLAFLLPTPNCTCYLDPTAGLVLVPAVFAPEVHPLAVGATAEVLLRLPATPAIFGFSMTTQWLDLVQMATSNAIRWTVGTALPQLDMALVEGNPIEPMGTVSTHLAHVLRFEYQ
jgi:hypothetical protein